MLLTQYRDKVRDIALRHHVASVKVFGSVLHGDDAEGSDLDLLVEPTAQTTMFDIGGIQFEVSELLGIRVD
ncbi:MAG: nucleotidyltransferase family protein, partial [Polaromonas sp.]